MGEILFTSDHANEVLRIVGELNKEEKTLDQSRLLQIKQNIEQRFKGHEIEVNDDGTVRATLEGLRDLYIAAAVPDRISETQERLVSIVDQQAMTLASNFGSDIFQIEKIEDKREVKYSSLVTKAMQLAQLLPHLPTFFNVVKEDLAKASSYAASVKERVWREKPSSPTLEFKQLSEESANAAALVVDIEQLDERLDDLKERLVKVRNFLVESQQPDSSFHQLYLNYKARVDQLIVDINSL